MDDKVYIYRCESYNKEALRPVIDDYFTGSDVFNGKKVLLKPNMLQAHDPSENVTTRPELVETVAEYVIDNGGTCAVGDCPSGRGRENVIAAAEKTGFLGICRRLNIEFEHFEGQDMIPVEVKNGRIYEKIFLAANYFKYDIVVNMPKLKTHGLTVFTLGVKNMMGLIPGLGKSDMHRKATRTEDFVGALADLYSVVKPAYTILDAVEAMHGSGPVGGSTIKLNRIFMSQDANALDAVAEDMCGIDPHKVRLTREIANRSLGNIDNIVTVKKYDGADNEFVEFKVPILPSLGEIVPGWVASILSFLLRTRPSVKKNTCVKCGKCSEVCPADAVAYSSSGYPVFNVDICVRCFCCAERCPKSAIVEKKNWLARYL